jgi:hypothetical protein
LAREVPGALRMRPSRRGSRRPPSSRSPPRSRPRGPRLPHPPSPRGEETWTYRVVDGDTLIGISNRFLVRPGNWPALQKLNAIANPRHLQPDSAVRIPLSWMQQSPMVAEVVFVRGPVTVVSNAAPASAAGSAVPPSSAAPTPAVSTPRPLNAGDTLRAQDLVHTGKDASMTLRLADGSRLLVAPESDLRVDRLLSLGRDRIPASRFDLDRGDAEIRVTPVKVDRSFEVRTPAVNLGVRGTQFRAHADAAVAEASAASAPSTRAEVLEGRVGAEAGASQVLVGAGQGAVAVRGQPIAPPRALVPAPDPGPATRRLERVPLVFTWAPLAGATSYHAQVFAPDAPGAPEQLLLDGRFPSPAAKWADLPDGRYQLVVRCVDADRLEGLDARVAFELKARPEPPFTIQPAAGAKSYGDRAELRWARVVAAAHYRLQVAATPDFAQPVIDEARIDEPARAVPLPPGTWHWRVGSIAARADGSDDPGPWGDAQAFTQRPIPPIPAVEPPRADAAGVHLQWKHPAAGETVHVQVATDAAFASLVLDRTTGDDSAVLPTPQPGVYFVRAKTIDADGFEGAFGSTQQIEVPRPPGKWWLLLLPEAAALVF